MSMFSDIFGTMRNSFRIGGLAGVRLVHQGGNLQIRNGGDTTYQNLHCNSLNLETPLPVAEGGTGATTAADARTNLGAAANTYSSSVSGFAPTTVAAALDELAAYRPLALASNGNGVYFRTEEGFQVCYSSGLTLAYSTPTVLQLAWTFPASFSASPATCVTLRNVTSTAVALADVSELFVGGLSNTSATIQLTCAAAGADRFAAGETAIVQAVAIGRWK